MTQGILQLMWTVQHAVECHVKLSIYDWNFDNPFIYLRRPTNFLDSETLNCFLLFLYIFQPHFYFFDFQQQYN